MNVREDLYTLKGEFKELARERRTCRLFCPTNKYSELFVEIQQWLPRLVMMVLYVAAFFYFVARIVLFRIGWLRTESLPKFSKSKKKKVHHVHATALNIDSRVQNAPMF